MDQIKTHNGLKRPHPRRSMTGRVWFLSLGLLSTAYLCFVMRQELIWTITTVGHVFGRPSSATHFRPLKFGRDGTFEITVFNDLHFGEGEDNPPEWGWGPISDQKTLQVMNSVLDREEQQLVVLNGDLITGENTHLHNATRYLDMIVQPLVQRRLKWASTYGNHDRDFNLSVSALLRAEQKYWRNSLTMDMVHSHEAGASNYVLPVYSSWLSPVPAMHLWFFDSRGGREFQQVDANGEYVNVEGFVHPDAVEWFLRTSKHLRFKYRQTIPSLAFVHIPTYATAAFQKTGIDPKRQPGINDDDPLAPQSLIDDEYTGKDEPFMKALTQVPGLLAVFSGHDHGDDWCHRWEGRYTDMNITGNGVFMCFGRHTGYGGYGRWTRGGRQIRLKEGSRAVETWIRLEDGSVSGRVVLNETYGNDEYPAVNRTFSS